jgi:hypothetical protein
MYPLGMPCGVGGIIPPSYQLSLIGPP